jgi:hypothetical protein
MNTSQYSDQYPSSTFPGIWCVQPFAHDIFPLHSHKWRLEGDKDKALILDTLAIHMIRRATNSTLISYHPNHKSDATLLRGLHARVRLIGASVYWQNIFTQTTDITFLFLAAMWQPVYAWDQALEALYLHISTLVSNHPWP